MNHIRISEALGKVLDALDEQALELRLFQRNLKDLSFELADLKATMLEYDHSLGRVRGNAMALGDTQRQLAFRL